MDQERFNNLEKKVNYLNEEGFAGENKQFMLFEDSEAAIEAIRNNQVPGITWTEEDESKWQASLAIDKALGGEERETQCDEFNDGNLDADVEDEWYLEDVWEEIPDDAQNVFNMHEMLQSNIESWEAHLRKEQFKEYAKNRNSRPSIDWTNPNVPTEAVDFEWESLFEDDLSTVEKRSWTEKEHKDWKESYKDNLDI